MLVQFLSNLVQTGIKLLKLLEHTFLKFFTVNDTFRLEVIGTKLLKINI